MKKIGVLFIFTVGMILSGYAIAWVSQNVKARQASSPELYGRSTAKFLKKRLALSPDQAKEVEKTLIFYRKKANVLEIQEIGQWHDLYAILDSASDTEQRRQADAIAETEHERAKLRLSGILQIRSLLSDDQKLRYSQILKRLTSRSIQRLKNIPE